MQLPVVTWLRVCHEAFLRMQLPTLLAVFSHFSVFLEDGCFHVREKSVSTQGADRSGSVTCRGSPSQSLHVLCSMGLVLRRADRPSQTHAFHVLVPSVCGDAIICLPAFGTPQKGLCARPFLPWGERGTRRHSRSKSFPEPNPLPHFWVTRCIHLLPVSSNPLCLCSVSTQSRETTSLPAQKPLETSTWSRAQILPCLRRPYMACPAGLWDLLTYSLPPLCSPATWPRSVLPLLPAPLATGPLHMRIPLPATLLPSQAFQVSTPTSLLQSLQMRCGLLRDLRGPQPHQLAPLVQRVCCSYKNTHILTVETSLLGPPHVNIGSGHWRRR